MTTGNIGRREGLLYGLLAGAVGAACMTPLRILARRSRLIDRTVPEVMEEKLAAKLGRGHGRPPAEHHVLDHLLHISYGASLGSLFGLVTARRAPAKGALPRGLTFGALTWLLGSGIVVPALGAARPLWRARPGEALTDLGAHLLYGVTAAIVAQDLSRQRDHGPSSDLRRASSRVG